MQKLDVNFKKCMFGGGRPQGSKNIKRSYAKKPSSNAALLKKMDDLTYKAGMASMAVATSMASLIDGFNLRPENPGTLSYSPNLGSGGYYQKSKSSSFSSVVRPTIRYGAYAHRSSLMFGLPCV